jgi:response regulator of citrate/malate metabolism
MTEHTDPTFIVMGQSITLISDECAHGLNTAADMGDFIYYMGNEYPTISTAIFAWQEVNNKLLSNQELRQVMIDNGIIEGDKNASQENSQEDIQETSQEVCEEITDQDIIQEDSQEGNQKAN